ncbi:MAG: hypothetical protein U0610_01540 [bacterium]
MPAALVQRSADEALPLFETVRQLLPEGRRQAVTLGDIARIRADKGDVDGALALHEKLAIVEGSATSARGR